jgi:hypothetical protein
MPGRQVINRGIDLRRAHVEPPRHRGQPRQPPPRLMMDQRGRHPVGQHTGKDPSAPGTCPAGVVCPVRGHSA